MVFRFLSIGCEEGDGGVMRIFYYGFWGYGEIQHEQAKFSPEDGRQERISTDRRGTRGDGGVRVCAGLWLGLQSCFLENKGFPFERNFRTTGRWHQGSPHHRIRREK